LPFYTRTDTGELPVLLPEAKAYLKLGSADHPDDDLVLLLLKSVTDFCEKYTGRDVRANTYTLQIDEFDDPICLKAQVDSITSIEYRDDQDTPATQTVASSVYYLTEEQQWSEIRLDKDQEWPDGSTDVLTVSERKHSITITFVTKPAACIDQLKLGLLQHLAFLYENRGDCNVTPANAVKLSGANYLYDQVRISRI
jgi:hypothetical protein